MILLAVDVETTGLSPKTDEITELGAVLYDTDTKQPISFYCEYVLIEGTIPIKITKLTGITNEQVQSYGIVPARAVADFKQLCTRADYIVAHNAPFDKGFLDNLCERHRETPPENHWIDTSVDVPYPESIATRKLEFLGPAHGFLNPWSHRALFDVLSMMKVLDHYNIEDVVKLSKEEDITLVATTSPPWKDGGVSNGLAKERGYRWNGDATQWQKKVKESQAEAEQQHGQFKVQVLEQ